MIQVPKIVIIDTDDLINGRLVVAGQVVTVPDDYGNVRRVLRTLTQQGQAQKDKKAGIGLRKLANLLAEQYPQEWQWLNRPKNQTVYDELMEWLRADASRITRALRNPDWLIERVRKYVQGQQNGR